MFSICLNGIFAVDGFGQTPGLIEFTSWQSTTPFFSSCCSGISPSFSPVATSIHARLAASRAGSYLAAAFSASSLFMP